MTIGAPIVERAKNRTKQDRQPARARAFPIRQKMYRIPVPPLMGKFENRAGHVLLERLFFFGKFNTPSSPSTYPSVHFLEKPKRRMIGVVTRQFQSLGGREFGNGGVSISTNRAEVSVYFRKLFMAVLRGRGQKQAVLSRQTTYDVVPPFQPSTEMKNRRCRARTTRVGTTSETRIATRIRTPCRSLRSHNDSVRHRERSRSRIAMEHRCRQDRVRRRFAAHHPPVAIEFGNTAPSLSWLPARRRNCSSRKRWRRK